MVAADLALSELLGCMGELAEAQGVAGRGNVEAALHQSRLILIEACIDDGVTLDAASVGGDFGVVDGDD